MLSLKTLQDDNPIHYRWLCAYPDTVLPPSLPCLSQPQAQGGSTMVVNNDLGIKHVSHRLKAKQYYKIN